MCVWTCLNVKHPWKGWVSQEKLSEKRVGGRTGSKHTIYYESRVGEEWKSGKQQRGCCILINCNKQQQQKKIYRGITVSTKFRIVSLLAKTQQIWSISEAASWEWKWCHAGRSQVSCTFTALNTEDFSLFWTSNHGNKSASLTPERRLNVKMDCGAGVYTMFAPHLLLPAVLWRTVKGEGAHSLVL